MSDNAHIQLWLDGRTKGLPNLLFIHKPATTFHSAHREVFTLLFPKALLETGTKSTMN